MKLLVPVRRENRIVLGVAFFIVFVALSITFILLALGAFTGITAIHQLGGWFGIVTALLAWYGSFAVVYNSTAGRPVLPVWPAK